MLRTARFSVDLSQYVAGHPDDLEQLPDRDQYQKVPVTEACRVVAACFRQGQGRRLAPVYAECVRTLPPCMYDGKLCELVLTALGRGDVDESAPFAQIALLRRDPHPVRPGPWGCRPRRPEPQARASGWLNRDRAGWRNRS